MKHIKIHLLAVLVLFCLPITEALAYMPFFGSEPFPPYERTESNASLYRAEVESFQRDVEFYISMAENDARRIRNEYYTEQWEVDEANQELREIADCVDEAIRQLNDVIDQYNSWIEFGY